MLFTHKSLTCKCECLPHNASHLVSTLGWTLWLPPVWLRVFNIKCRRVAPNIKFSKSSALNERSIKYPTIGMKPSATPSVTSSFQHQVLSMKKHEKILTRNEPFSCPQCESEFSTSSALNEDAWKKNTQGSVLI